MNVAQELGDDELYDYDVLVKLLSDRFDPASRVSASRSRFHGRMRRHHEDADVYADTITELCRVGYPQSSPELRQELISEQFVRGQSIPELKKYLWVVIRTQKDCKLQTLIEVSNIHRPAQWQWTGRGVLEPTMPPSLQHMFALARRMGYEMRPIARRAENSCRPQESPRTP